MKDWKKEYEKCKNDEVYFFENYCLINGKKPGKYTVEKFKNYIKMVEVGRKILIAKGKTGYIYFKFRRDYPILPKDCFPQSNFEE